MFALHQHNIAFHLQANRTLFILAYYSDYCFVCHSRKGQSFEQTKNADPDRKKQHVLFKCLAEGDENGHAQFDQEGEEHQDELNRVDDGDPQEDEDYYAAEGFLQKYIDCHYNYRMSSSRQDLDYKLRFSNWLSRLASRYCDSPLQYYLPMKQTLATDLDTYQGKYSQQQDFLYFKSMLQC